MKFLQLTTLLATVTAAVAIEHGPGCDSGVSETEFSGNPKCHQLDIGVSFAAGWKIDGGCQEQDGLYTTFGTSTGGECAADVTGSATVTCSSDGIEATITPSSDVFVIMKGSNGGTVYELKANTEYTLDCGAWNNNGNRQAISHIEFCFTCTESDTTPTVGETDTGASDPAPEPAAEADPVPEPASDGGEDPTSKKAETGEKTNGGGSNNGGGQAGSADETCAADDKLGPGNGGDYRCCAGPFNDGKYFGECETSSCVENFDSKNLLCHNYGAKNHPVSDDLSTTKKGGSNNCPYVEADQAICDTSAFTAINGGKNCRDEKGNNHCLGYVKCGTGGVTVPKNGHSDGTADGGNDCGHAEPRICFYMGASENWKVCGNDGADDFDEMDICVEVGNSGNYKMEKILVGAMTGAELIPGQSKVDIDGVEHTLTSVCDVEAPEPEPVPEPVSEPEEVPIRVTAPEPEPEPQPRTAPPPGASGDPHFKTWAGAKYDYHGECDLVLVNNPSFADGTGLRVHIRTTRVKYFSFIEKVAVMIGSDVLEFDNDVDNFLLNGRSVPAKKRHQKTRLDGYLVRRDTKFLSIRLSEGQGARIDLHMRRNGFPAVIVDGKDTEVFKGSLGLLGDWETGKKLARDGKTELEDVTTFALEWQVRDNEPMLFQDARFPQFPTVCTPPEKMPTRLGMSNFEQAAEKACAHWKEDKEDCIFDVIATRDVLIAEEGHLVHVE